MKNLIPTVKLVLKEQFLKITNFLNRQFEIGNMYFKYWYLILLFVVAILNFISSGVLELISFVVFTFIGIYLVTTFLKK